MLQKVIQFTLQTLIRENPEYLKSVVLREAQPAVREGRGL